MSGEPDLSPQPEVSPVTGSGPEPGSSRVAGLGPEADVSRVAGLGPEADVSRVAGLGPEADVSLESGSRPEPAVVGGTSVPSQAEPAEFQRRPGVLRTILGRDQDDEDQPLPDFPPLPEDPRWRIEHMPLVVAVGFALVLCAASVGFLVDGGTAALGAAAGVLVVTIGYSMTTLAIAWADALRPALVMPVGLAAYVIKYLLIGFIMVAVAGNGWAGGIPMAWGIAAGAVLLTAVQVWWISRLARRNFPAGGLDRS